MPEPFPINRPARRQELRMALWLAFYVVAVFGAGYLIEVRQVSGVLAWALALLPGVAMAGAIFAQGRRIAEQKDEFQRMLLVRQHLIATGFTLSVVTAWSFLELYGLVGDSASPIWIVVVWAFGLVVGAVSNRIAYGTTGRCG